MEWEKLLSKERLGKNKKRSISKYDVRSPFESDIDRIIFSRSFRRLSKKTQVHPFSRNDHVHTRLTHSLEVAEVGKSLGMSLGKRIKKDLPSGISYNDIGSIVQAACLAHDIGNPPFGHAGEAAITHWFKSGSFNSKLQSIQKELVNDLEMFEGNAQGFRIITQLENQLFDGGLGLTYSTLAAFLKYPWVSSTVKNNQKFGVFISEKDILENVAEKTGLVKISKNKYCRHPLAFLTEAADDICYATIDLEDAVELNIINYEEAKKLLLNIFEDKEKDKILHELKDERSYRVNFARLRGPVFDKLISDTIDTFMNNKDKIMSGEFRGELISSLNEDNKSRQLISKAKSLGKESIYTETFKSEVELGCFSTFECLLEAFCNAAIE